MQTQAEIKLLGCVYRNVNADRNQAPKSDAIYKLAVPANLGFVSLKSRLTLYAAIGFV